MQNNTSKNSDSFSRSPVKYILLTILALGSFAALVANYVIKETEKQEQRARQLEEMLTNKTISNE
ncbi:MAG: hypothetical protein ACRCVU_06980 [Flavobacterium sp.]